MLVAKSGRLDNQMKLKDNNGVQFRAHHIKKDYEK